MSGDETKRAERFIELANAYRNKKIELDFLEEALFSEFPDAKYKPLIDEFIANETTRSTATGQTPISFETVWQRTEKILQSGAFYFFAGLAMLFYAMHASNNLEHPSLIFLIAMLGFAIMLFGTGSQAAGAIATMGARLPTTREASVAGGVGVPAGTNQTESGGASADKPDTIEPANSREWSPIKANAAIAGGAAVLTAIFGLGVIKYKDDIRDIFNDFQRYEEIAIEACTGPLATCKPGERVFKQLRLENYHIRAENASGKSIHAYQNDRKIVLLAFRDDMRGGSYIRLIASRARNRDEGMETIESQRLKDNLDLAFQLPEKSASKESSVSPADCRATQTSDDCALYRVDLKDTGTRVKVHAFSLNFAKPNPATARGEQLELE